MCSSYENVHQLKLPTTLLLQTYDLTFDPQTHPEDGEGIDWLSEMDRLMVMKIIIKMADINTPTKSFDLHRSWTERITEEFYQQSEEEMVLGLSPTIFMDRNHPEKLPAIQLSFIQHLVSPLFQGAAAAGIIPGILETTAKIDGKEMNVIVVMSLSVTLVEIIQFQF